MQCRSMLVHYCRRLGAAVAIRAIEIPGVDAMLAESALECGAAVRRFGRPRRLRTDVGWGTREPRG